jgi:hypothetical protein
MNYDVICNYIEVFNTGVWVLTFYVVLFVNELLMMSKRPTNASLTQFIGA